MSDPIVEIETTCGNFAISLDVGKAPATVENFLRYVDDGHYVGTVFHRIIRGFMAQGGGYDEKYDKKPVKAPVKNEADNGLRNMRATVAMARTSDPNSATAQFFVNLANNAFLDHKSPTPSGWGYAVFGKVVDGMNMVEEMANVDTGAKGPFGKDAPLTDVVITRMARRGS